MLSVNPAAPPPPSQGILSSLLSRVNPKPNYNAYTPYFTQLVAQLALGGNGMQRAHTLQLLELYLTAGRSFEGSFSVASARKDLFAAWEALLNEPPSNLQAMDLILTCMLRDELSLRSGLTGDDVREYERILWKTFTKASSLLKPSFGQGFKSTVESFFASQVLALFFFRLPGFGPVVVDGLNAKPKESRSPQGFFVAPAAEKPARRSFRASAPATAEDGDETAASRESAPATSSPLRSAGAQQLASSPSATGADAPAMVESPERDAKERRFFACAPDLFNWTQRLHQLDQDKEFVLSKEEAARWTVQLATKDAFFLSFVETYAVTVRRAVPPGQTPAWSAAPAYELVLATFAPLLRSAVWWDSIVRRMPGQGVGWVTSLPGYLRVKKTACALLQNDPDLLSLFCHTVFECTNANSLLSVDSCVEHLNLFFTCAAVPGPPRPQGSAAPQGLVTQSSKAGESLPSSFDYDDFWDCFGKLMNSEGFQVLLKVCSFLYNNLHLFHGKSRMRLINDLLGKHFFRLFLHWSPEVRTAFQHVLVYKVLRADRRFLPCFSDSQVMLLYGTGKAKRVPVSSPRVALSAKAAWGKTPQQSPSGNSLSSASPSSGTEADPPATADEVAQLTRSAQRRLALFDRANVVDDEELWSDMSFSSKIDSYVRMCLMHKEEDEAAGSQEPVLLPKQLRVYCESSLEQYALLLIRYYRGVTLNSLEDIPETLSHRMVISEFTSET